MSDNSTSSGGTGVCGLLGVLFVGLKLTGYVDWSWWWVTLPFWGGLAVALLICAVALVGAGVTTFVNVVFKPKRW